MGGNLYYLTDLRAPSPLSSLETVPHLHPEDLIFLLRRRKDGYIVFVDTKHLAFWEVKALSEAPGTVVFYAASWNDTIKTLKSGVRRPVYVQSAQKARETLRPLLQRLTWNQTVSGLLNTLLDEEEAVIEGGKIYCEPQK